jgi:hypothetical protein
VEIVERKGGEEVEGSERDVNSKKGLLMVLENGGGGVRFMLLVKYGECSVGCVVAVVRKRKGRSVIDVCAWGTLIGPTGRGNGSHGHR